MSPSSELNSATDFSPEDGKRVFSKTVISACEFTRENPKKSIAIFASMTSSVAMTFLRDILDSKYEISYVIFLL